MIGGLTAMAVSERQPEKYSASATLLVNAGVSTSNFGSVQAGQNLTDTYSLWAISQPVLERSAELLEYDGGANALAKVVHAEPVPGTLFIEVSATDTDPEYAALIANTVADQFMLGVWEQMGSQNIQASSGITEQIESVTQTIAGLDTAIGQLESRDEPLTVNESGALESLREERLRRQRELERLEERLGALDIELLSAQTQFILSSPAVAPESPYAPNTIRSTAIGMALGLTLAVAASAVLEHMDNTVRSREELAHSVDAPVLATIPAIQGFNEDKSSLFLIHQPKSTAAEAMRLLRVNLEFTNAPRQLSTLAIASPGPDEGKSTVTANLGVALAQTGLRTVIIDADLRRPSQHDIFGIDNDRGLSTLLASMDPDWHEAAMALSIKNLVLIPGGPIPPNPSELLSLDRFSQILQGVSEWADIVLIDSSPVLATSEALIISTRAEGTLLVARARQTRHDSVRQASSSLRHAHVHLAGAVLTFTQPDEIESYGDYEQTDQQASRSRPRYYFGAGREPGLKEGVLSVNGHRSSPTIIDK